MPRGGYIQFYGAPWIGTPLFQGVTAVTVGYTITRNRRRHMLQRNSLSLLRTVSPSRRSSPRSGIRLHLLDRRILGAFVIRERFEYHCWEWPNRRIAAVNADLISLGSRPRATSGAKHAWPPANATGIIFRKCPFWPQPKAMTTYRTTQLATQTSTTFVGLSNGSREFTTARADLAIRGGLCPDQADWGREVDQRLRVDYPSGGALRNVAD